MRSSGKVINLQSCFLDVLPRRSNIKTRSSHPDVLCTKGVLRNFAKFFFNKVAGFKKFEDGLLKLKACNFIKKETLAL